MSAPQSPETGYAPPIAERRTDGVEMVHPEDALLSMIRVADGLGHYLTWAHARAAWSGSSTSLRVAADALLGGGVIDVSARGFRLPVTCPTHKEER